MRCSSWGPPESFRSFVSPVRHLVFMPCSGSSGLGVDTRPYRLAFKTRPLFASSLLVTRRSRPGCGRYGRFASRGGTMTVNFWEARPYPSSSSAGTPFFRGSFVVFLCYPSLTPSNRFQRKRKRLRCRLSVVNRAVSKTE